MPIPSSASPFAPLLPAFAGLIPRSSQANLCAQKSQARGPRTQGGGGWRGATDVAEGLQDHVKRAFIQVCRDVDVCEP